MTSWAQISLMSTLFLSAFTWAAVDLPRQATGTNQDIIHTDAQVLSSQTMPQIFSQISSAQAWASHLRKSFETSCTLSIPMRSEMLFVQPGEALDFYDVTQQGAGNPYSPYCTLTISSQTHSQQVAKTGKVTIDGSLHEFEAPEILLDSQDFLGTPGVSIRFFTSLDSSAQTVKSPFTGAHCFIPESYIALHSQGNTPLVAFTLNEVEQELASLCQQQAAKTETLPKIAPLSVKSVSKKLEKPSKKSPLKGKRFRK